MKDLISNQSKLSNSSLSCKKYSTYNQLVKDNDIITLSKSQYEQLPKEVQEELKYVMTIGKNKLPPDNEPPTWFKAWTNEFENRIDGKLNALKNELKQDISNVRTELKQDIVNVRTELKQDIVGINSRLDKLENDVGELKQNVVSINSRLDKLENDVGELKQNVVQINQRLDNIVKLNNLRE